MYESIYEVVRPINNSANNNINNNSNNNNEYDDSDDAEVSERRPADDPPKAWYKEFEFTPPNDKLMDTIVG